MEKTLFNKRDPFGVKHITESLKRITFSINKNLQGFKQCLSFQDDRDLMAGIQHLDQHQNQIKCSWAQMQTDLCRETTLEKTWNQGVMRVKPENNMITERPGTADRESEWVSECVCFECAPACKVEPEPNSFPFKVVV